MSTTNVACPVCGACSYIVASKRKRRDHIEVRSLRCKCCTFVWQIATFQDHTLTDEEYDLIKITHETPKAIASVDVGRIRILWARVSLLPIRADMRELIQELGFALERAGLVADDDCDDEELAENCAGGVKTA